MPRETGNHQGAGEVFASNRRACLAIHRTVYGSNVGFYSLSAADDCCAYRNDYYAGQGGTFG